MPPSGGERSQEVRGSCRFGAGGVRSAESPAVHLRGQERSIAGGGGHGHGLSAGVCVCVRVCMHLGAVACIGVCGRVRACLHLE